MTDQYLKKFISWSCDLIVECDDGGSLSYLQKSYLVAKQMALCEFNSRFQAQLDKQCSVT